MARICIDLDGVIANLKKTGETYRDISPVPGAPEKLRELKKNGHYLIIQTARHLKTCGANTGLVNARIAKDTLNWLESHEIPFDEINFGKPWAQIYIDDNALRFESWENIAGDGSSFPVNCEEAAGAGGNVN